ncbi:hypothetical protein BT69DRAFT_1282438 [Atractiella rhizophila]|nr:hypothetical protein BT69DRAFT_1282438 [Atractiella rhizophila]
MIGGVMLDIEIPNSAAPEAVVAKDGDKDVRKGSGKERVPPIAKYEACNPCRVRKVRCDGNLPCGACSRSKNSKRGSSLAQSCEYTPNQQKRPRYILNSSGSGNGSDASPESGDGKEKGVGEVDILRSKLGPSMS